MAPVDSVPPEVPGDATRRATRRVVVTTAASMALAAGAGLAWWRQSRTTLQGAGEAASADPLSSMWSTPMQRPDGSVLTLDTMRSGGLVLNFWATWCAPCVREFPQLDRVAMRWAPRGWRMVGIAVDQADAVRAFTRRLPVSFDIVVAGFDALSWSRALGNDQGGLPFTVVLAPGGRVLHRLLGETTEASLDALLTDTPQKR